MNLIVAPDVLVAHLSGEAVLLDLRDKNYYRLNETAAVVWKAIEEGSPRAEILRRVTSQFDVDEETAGNELDRLVRKFAELGLLSNPDIPDEAVADL